MKNGGFVTELLEFFGKGLNYKLWLANASASLDSNPVEDAVVHCVKTKLFIAPADAIAWY